MGVCHKEIWKSEAVRTVSEINIGGGRRVRGGKPRGTFENDIMTTAGRTM